MIKHQTKQQLLRFWLLPALALSLFFAAMSGRTWTVDGCIMTLNTDHFMDNASYGHFFLRPSAFVWVALWKALGVRTPEGWYHVLRVLLTGFGVAALTLLFNVARRRPPLAAAVAALAALALSRNVLRQLALLDEKGIGMFFLALAIFGTARFFETGPLRRGVPPAPAKPAKPGAKAPRPKPPAWSLYPQLPPRARAAGAWLGVSLLWVLAVFGHLQNIPFALGFLATPLFFLGPERPWRRRLKLVLALAGSMAAAGFLLFIILHWNVGGFGALPLLVHNLFFKNPAPCPASAAQLWEGALQGWIKAFFNVDRLSPRAFLPLAAAGFALLALAAGWGAWRRRDPLAKLLLFGCLMQMLLMPLTNSYPDFGDSYTSLVLGALLLLAAAPWRLVASAAVLLALVNLPAQWSLSHPPLTMKEHLARMEEAQLSFRGAPWAAVAELVREPPNDQEFCPIYYPMDPDLAWTSTTLAKLPAGPCLIELPLNVERNGALGKARIAEVRKLIEQTGRRVTPKQLWSPPRVIRSDFKAYGPYFEVEAK